MASRLQKLGSLGLSVLQNGIDLEMSYSRTLSKALIRKRVVLRGAGEQIVYVSRNEFNRLPKKERDQFQDV